MGFTKTPVIVTPGTLCRPAPIFHIDKHRTGYILEEVLSISSGLIRSGGVSHMKVSKRIFRGCFFFWIIAVLLLAMGSCKMTPEKAKKIHMAALVVDGHSDILNRLTRQGENQADDKGNALELPLNKVFKYSGGDPKNPAAADSGKVLGDIGEDITVDTQNLFESSSLPKTNRNRHHDLPKMKRGGMDVSMTAAWTSSPSNPVYARSRALALMNTLFWNERRNSDIYGVAASYDEILSLAAQKKLISVLTMEGGDMFTKENGIELLRQFADLGLMVLGPIYTSSTPLANADRFTDWGKDIVREAQRLGILIDVSHMGTPAGSTTDQAIKLAAEGGYPLIHTHGRPVKGAGQTSGMTDAQLKAIAESGGVVGVMMHIPGGLFAKDYRVSHIVQNIHYAAGVMGVDHVGLGSDADGGITLPTDMTDIGSLYLITQGLAELGYSKEDLEKILGGNFMRTFQKAKSMAAPVKKAEDITFTPLLDWGEYGYYTDSTTPLLQAKVEGKAAKFRVIVDGIAYTPEYSANTGILSLQMPARFPNTGIGKDLLREYFHVVSFEAENSAGAIARKTEIFYVSSVMEFLFPGKKDVKVFVRQDKKGDWKLLGAASDKFRFAIDYLPLNDGNVIETGDILVKLIFGDGKEVLLSELWASNTSRKITFDLSGA